jgi:hypothetical protein
MHVIAALTACRACARLAFGKLDACIINTPVVLGRRLSSAHSIVRAGRSWRCRAVGAFASLVALLACSPCAVALAAPLTAASEVGRGVVWIHQGQVLFEGYRSGSVSLGSASDFNTTLASSSSAVALGGGSNSLDASIPPSPLERIEGLYEGVSGGGGSAVSRSGCSEDRL